MTFALDVDTGFSLIDEISSSVEVTSNWNIGTYPSGGYILALCCRYLLSHLPQDFPLAVSVHFASPAVPGPGELKYQEIKIGKTSSTGSVMLFQNGKVKAHVTLTAVDYDSLSGKSWPRDEICKPVVPREKCIQTNIPVELAQRLELSLTADTFGWLKNKYTPKAEIEGWVGFSDQRPMDVLSLLLFTDAFPPALFAREGILGWLPTVEFSVQLRQLPTSDHVYGNFVSTSLCNGVVEEDGQLRDADGNLLALTRQVVRVMELSRNPDAPKSVKQN